jgi:hypothetical protein
MPSFGTLKADTLTHSTAGSLATNFVVNGSAKAWSIFDQVNDVTDDSLNISTMTDRGQGSIYGAYTSSMSSIAHAVMAATSPNPAGSMTTSNTNRGSISTADTTGRYSMNVFDVDSSVALQNEQCQQALVHGDLA